MSGERDHALSQTTDSEEASEERGGLLSFFMGWVFLPGLVIGSIIGLGAHWGARHPDAWYVGAVKWVVEALFGT